MPSIVVEVRCDRGTSKTSWRCLRGREVDGRWLTKYPMPCMRFRRPHDLELGKMACAADHDYDTCLAPRRRRILLAAAAGVAAAAAPAVAAATATLATYRLIRI